MNYRTLALAPLMLAIAGCAGGSTGSSTTGKAGVTNPNPPSYSVLFNNTDATLTIGGPAYNSDGTNTTPKNITGTYNPVTQTLTLSDGTNSFTSDPATPVVIPTGYPSLYRFVDTTGQTAQIGNPYDSATITNYLPNAVNLLQGYRYVTFMKFTNGQLAVPPLPGQNQFSNTGFVGVLTNVPDMPTSGQATYSGQGDAEIIYEDVTTVGGTTTRNSYYIIGNTQITADFSAGTVSVLLNGLTASKRGTGAVNQIVPSPVSEVRGSNMAINGNQFSGGNWVISNGNAALADSANATIMQNTGAFFGYDPAISAPDEVAGIMLMKIPQSGTTTITPERNISAFYLGN